ncbi:MAG: helix-turn-helix transcriptional regulator [Holophagales bacterium]|nr:helix-turn-helix transcriptional regulator [Gemmatimonadota bacterium]MYJ25486.1 helix-turn-helix transcriptional regulator [Holophagales bacterium]
MRRQAEALRVQDLAQLLRDRRATKGLGLRAAAEEAGVSFNTLARVEKGHVPDIETFSRIARWVGHSPAEFLEAASVTLDSTPEVIEAHLRGDPALTSDAAEAIAGLVRELYSRLAEPAEVATACHLRAASTFKPEASALFAELLGEMHSALLAED